VRLLDQTDEPENAEKVIKGYISIDLLKAVLPFDDYDFYLCGPPPFMDALYNGLRDMNVADKRIYFESFGPASVTRRPDGDAPALPSAEPATEPVGVRFEGSDKAATWTPESGSLLDLAEEAGLSPPFSCRMGSCGSCKTKLLSGKVAYDTVPNFPLAEDEVLICCATPAAGSDTDEAGLVLDL